MITIRKRNNLYEYRFEAGKVNGKRKQITKCGFKTKNEAYTAGQKAYDEFINGVTTIECNMLYGDYWMKEYFEINYKYSTAKRYKESFRNIKKELGNYKLSVLTPYILNQALLKLYQTSSTRDALRNYQKVIKSSLRDATYFFGFIKNNPAAELEITIDIMNICAAFECQFDRTYPKFKSKKFNDIKNDVLTNLEVFKSSYKKDKVGQEILDGIILNVKNYKDVLKFKLEYALKDFEQLYTTKARKYMDIKFDFKDNYIDMPSRIKTARNQLDHGNTKVKINYDVLTDTILLRAITYFMIFKSAGMNKTNIMKCIRKFTRFGV